MPTDPRKAWLAELSPAWRRLPVSYLAEVSLGKMLDSTDGPGKKKKAYLRAANVLWDKIMTDDLAEMFFTADEERRLELRSGDVLVCEGGEIGRTALVRNDLPDVHFQNSLLRVRTRRDVVDPAFFAYAMRAAGHVGAFTGDKATIGHLTSVKLRRQILPIPPVDAQPEIVRFLDVETAKIDSLIEKKNHLASRMAESNEAAAGLAYSEEFPRRRVSAVTSLIQCGPFGSQLGFDEYVPDGIPVINPQDIEGHGIARNIRTTVGELTRDRLSRHMVREDDIVMARRGQMGRAGLVTEQEQGWLCGTGSVLIRPRKSDVLPEFLHLVLTSPLSRSWLLANAVGTTMSNLNEGIVGRMPVPAPSLQAQAAILEQVVKARARSARLKDAITSSIERLRELRSALITAAVTGQIGVRSAA